MLEALTATQEEFLSGAGGHGGVATFSGGKRSRPQQLAASGAGGEGGHKMKKRVKLLDGTAADATAADGGEEEEEAELEEGADAGPAGGIRASKGGAVSGGKAATTRADKGGEEAEEALPDEEEAEAGLTPGLGRFHVQTLHERRVCVGAGGRALGMSWLPQNRESV